jgi:hypothetical protein
VFLAGGTTFWRTDKLKDLAWKLAGAAGFAAGFFGAKLLISLTQKSFFVPETYSGLAQFFKTLFTAFRWIPN